MGDRRASVLGATGESRGIDQDFLERADSMACQAPSGSESKSLNSPAPRSQRAPSMTTHSPLMYSDMSLRRKAARLVSSSWRPKRFIGCDLRACSSYCFEWMRRDQGPSVGDGAGASPVARIL